MISGSLRAGSYNSALLRLLPSLAPASFAMDTAPSFAEFPFYDADEHQRAGTPEAVLALAEAIRRSDGVVIVSPEYNWTIPGALKNAFDWLSRVENQPLKGKAVALQSASAGPLGGARMQYHMRMMLTFLEANLVATPEIFVGLAPSKFSEDRSQLLDGTLRTMIEAQLRKLEDVIRMTNWANAPDNHAISG
ncbi:NAD(P)H-dependent oxidoreductase [Sphingobium sp. WTD-1]|nr:MULTISPECIES: NADPH-dependent FMN reductase [Pseudomonadota]MCE4542310.1 NAD(P)H-dependent oxidoreductase [Caballeronia sp. PC1]MCE4545045.1 NAD(P)H-dependent oxidoreductase [Caballeronia sp. PC1]MCE4570173.1 NAD(P)H-dependent oxidoreductase [Caballeronia sp. CLC5]WIA58659.1 NAD(P)H-dependent oxidoreductase [Sphingobium sp. WTD-1]